MRTREQIIADCEKRFEELQREAEKPERKYPCKDCQWYSMKGEDGFGWPENFPQHHTCTHALVQGFRPWGVRVSNNPMPCGPEKALWEAKPKPPRKLTLCERIIEFLAGETA